MSEPEDRGCGRVLLMIVGGLLIVLGGMCVSYENVLGGPALLVGTIFIVVGLLFVVFDGIALFLAGRKSSASTPEEEQAADRDAQ